MEPASSFPQDSVNPRCSLVKVYSADPMFTGRRCQQDRSSPTARYDSFPNISAQSVSLD
jgi:hypothetical protein